MKKICFKVDSPYQNNQLFQERGDLNFLYRVKKILENKNHIVGTQDIIDEDEADILIYLDYRKDFRSNEKKKVLLAMESIAVIPKTFEKNYTDKFDLTFTFYEKIVDNNKIFKLNYSYDLTPFSIIKFKNKYKLICNISSNKFSNHPKELYSKRIESIEYFENYHKSEFDLYGFGWDQSFRFPNVYNLMKLFNQTKLTRQIIKIFKKIPQRLNPLLRNYSTYAGTIKDKYEVLNKYKFSICYENVSGVEGYITEKIFDCFKCGVVPIYLGPKEISEHIPKNSFLDRRNFKNDEELYLFIKNMREKEYDSYRTAALSFLNSSESNLFKSKVMAPWFVEKILEVK
jgi:alpha(1,3/1,4) fucosyltransferase